MTRLLVDAAIAPLSETWHEAARHAVEVVDLDGDWFESFAPKCWIRNGAGAEVHLGHDGQVIGRVNMVVPCRGTHMHVAELEIEGDEALLERVRVGQSVSLAFEAHDSDDEPRSRTRRYHLAEIHHVAILADRATPWYPTAKIISVGKLNDRQAPVMATAGGWRTMLPPGWEEFRNMNGDLEPGTMLLKGHQRSGGIVWDGRQFTLPTARLAA